MSFDEHSPAEQCVIKGLIMVLMQDAQGGLIISLCVRQTLWRANPLPAARPPLVITKLPEVGLNKEKKDCIPVGCSWPFHWWAGQWISLYVESGLFLKKPNETDYCLSFTYSVMKMIIIPDLPSAVGWIIRNFLSINWDALWAKFAI